MRLSLDHHYIYRHTFVIFTCQQQLKQGRGGRLTLSGFIMFGINSVPIIARSTLLLQHGHRSVYPVPCTLCASSFCIASQIRIDIRKLSAPMDLVDGRDRKTSRPQHPNIPKHLSIFFLQVNTPDCACVHLPGGVGARHLPLQCCPLLVCLHPAMRLPGSCHSATLSWSLAREQHKSQMVTRKC